MSTIFHVRGNRVIHLSAIWVLTSLVLGAIGCAKIVPGPDRVHVMVRPMHSGGVQEPMTKVARLQCRGNGFLLLRVDKHKVSHENPLLDYVEVSPGRHTLLLMPGHKLFEANNCLFFFTEYTYEEGPQFALSLDVKPNAWYHFCTYEVEEGAVTESVTQSPGWEKQMYKSWWRRTKARNVRFAPFEVLEIIDGKATTVATTVDFHRL